MIPSRGWTWARALGWGAALAAAGISLTRIGDYDIWYHLRAGRLILESGIPSTEPFAYTAVGAPASVQSWLAGVVYHLAERVAGFAGVQLLNAAIIAAVFALVFATAQLFSEGPEDAPLTAVLVVLAVFAARFRLGARPHVLEYLLLAVDLRVLQSLRARGRGPLWVLPLAQVVWVNVHGSHILGIALPLLFLVGDAGQRLLRGRGPWAEPRIGAGSPRALAAVAVANCAASLLNPAGWRSLQFPFSVASMRGYMDRIGEWQPITLDLLFGNGARYTWAFTAMAVIAVASIVATVASRRLALTDLLLLGTLGLLAFRGVRLIPEFAIATVPIVVRGLGPVFARWERRRRAMRWGAVGALTLALALAPLDPAYAYGLGVKERIFPGRAVAFARASGVTGNVFNSFAFGDYLVHRWPERKVYIHGRNEVFPVDFYEEYLSAHKDAALFARLAKRWGIEWILLEYELTDYARREVMTHLASNPEWVPIYWDRVAVIYVRAGGANSGIAARQGFRVIRPAWFDFSYLDGLVQRGMGPLALAELEELLARAPDNEEAWLARGYVDYSLGFGARAEGSFLKALEIGPKRAMNHSALGLLALERGDRQGARARFDRALELDGNDPMAIDGLGQLGVKVTPRDARPAGHP